jgi:hypothetical protein
MSLTFAKNWSKCLIHLENKVIKISEKKAKMFAQRRTKFNTASHSNL